MGKTYRHQPTANEDLAEGFRELRKGSRAQPHRNKAKYTRKTKYKGYDND